jgi:uncharacterized phage-like protein YoqJ
MKCLISGHRLFKLANYELGWIKRAIEDTILENQHLISYGYSGMASGVDLWFCQALSQLDIPYVACIPFEEQAETMEEDERQLREGMISVAASVRKVKNSWMVETSDMGIIVWDGNKGGTHNVLQQMVERKKPFFWINPVSQKIYNCT